jgi:hypothetical protein
LIGYLVNALFFRLERKLVFWSPASREVTL